MTDVSFQTVRLARGRHRAPQDGACVMELASMIAHEPFTDQPDSVCRVIAAVLRSYNDAVNDARRQDLYGCAAAVLGTRAPDSVERARAAHCLLAIEELRDARETSWRWRVSWASRRSIAAMRAHTALASAPSSRFGFFVGGAFSAAGERGHRRLLSLIEELVAIQGSERPVDGGVGFAPAGRGGGLAAV